LAHPAPMIGFCCLNFGEFTKTTTGYAYENNGIRFKPIKKEKGLRLPWYFLQLTQLRNFKKHPRNSRSIIISWFQKTFVFFALSKHLIVSYIRQLISLAKTMLAQPIHAHDSTSCGT
jgi:hypothetical protein